MQPTNGAGELNSAQKLHLLSSAQYADKLLADIESILSVASSKSPFPKYQNDLTLAQMKVVQDYLARMRSQMVRVLASQGIDPPVPNLGSIHSIRVTLAFFRIAFQECTADRMRGYGQVPEGRIREINGLVDEMAGLADKLDAYLAQGLGQDLQARLERLQVAGDQMELLRTIQRIVDDRGLVEFRPALSMILDRLENQAFEIAVFGRVSSGKSSLLNYIVRTDVLPVGVNPITAVPTRLVYGPEPRLTVWFAHKSPEKLEISRLPEFVTEQLNPTNSKHITRITAQLPSPRLRDGVVLVDTPGLGSLATSGAAETLAYLPRCDLGVVLIDAASTLTQDDLGTVHALYQAGIPACILLSKADLLSPKDQTGAAKYVSEQVKAQLGLTLSVHPVSVKDQFASALDRWLEEGIFPLYSKHQELAQDSVRRKIGALRESLETALRARVQRSARAPKEDRTRLHAVDTEIRKAVGRFEETRAFCFTVTDEIREMGDGALTALASRLLELCRGENKDPGSIIRETLTKVAADKAALIAVQLAELATMLAQVLELAAAALNVHDAPRQQELMEILKEMPRIDVGTLDAEIRPTLLGSFSRSFARRQIENELRKQIGARVMEAFSSYGRMLQAWSRTALTDLQRNFDGHADAYRALLSGLMAEGGTNLPEDDTLMRDLDALGRAASRDALVDTTAGS